MTLEAKSELFGAFDPEAVTEVALGVGLESFGAPDTEAET